MSGVCLVRVTSADGTAATALSFSYEFKLKVPSAGTTAEEAPTFSARASVPDTRTRSSWTADLVFSADTLRGGETMVFNFVEANCGTLDEFLDRWHQVRVQLKLDIYTGSVWVDGRLVLDGVPLRQSFDVALIPELMITCGADKPSGLRVEDIEVKYRDQTLKPKNEGEEVSQSMVSDSFETYRTGIFPRTGGWLMGMEKILGSSSEIRPGETPADALNVRPAGSLKDKGKRPGNAKTGAERESRGSEVLQSGGQAAQALNLSDGASENGAALIDEEDSVSGLRSFRLETEGVGPISVIKRFSLPSRVPFGVSGGSFAIGVKPSDSQRGTGLREGLDRESRLNERSDKAGKEYKSASSQGLGVENEDKPWADGRTSQLSSGQGISGGPKTVRTLSASPVGNYYLYSFDGKLLQMYDVYGTCLKDYIYMGDRLIAEYDHVGGRFLYYTPDQINSTRVVTNDAGTVVYSAAHDPYGGIQQTWVNTFDPLPKFSGKERDAESGLDYFGARYYSNPIYRWLSADSIKSKPGAISNPQRWNLYSYCGNNPLVYIDPDGSDQINIFLGFYRWDLKLDFSNLQETAKYAGHHITVYPFGSYDQAKFEESVKAKDTWTFFIGHSTPKDEKTGKRFGITIGVDSTWLTEFIISNNDRVGIFSCNSSDFAFDLFVAGTVFATTESLSNSSLGLEAGAYFLLDLLLQGEDPTTAMALATGFWAWTLGAAGPVEPAIVVEKKK